MRFASVRPVSSRPRIVRAAALLCAATLAVSACGADQDSPDDGPAGGSPGAASAPADPAEAELEPAVDLDVGDPPEVELLESGEGDRRVLRYAPSAGDEQRTVVTYSDSGSTAFPDSAPSETRTPEQEITVVGRTEPGVDGAQRAVARVEDFTTADEERAESFATAPGFTLEWRRTAPGTFSAVEFAAPTGADNVARAATEVVLRAVTDTAVVFPDEEIGVGARWTVTREVSDAVAPRRIATYTLEAVDGDEVTVSVEEEAPVESGEISAIAPDGQEVSLDVDSYDYTSTREFTVDLRGAVPISGDAQTTTKAVYADPVSGAKTTFDESVSLGFAPA